jgi:hypothetical protein
LLRSHSDKFAPIPRSHAGGELAKTWRKKPIVTSISPLLSLLALALALWPITQLFRSMSRTALRSAAVWVMMTEVAWLAFDMHVVRSGGEGWNWMLSFRLAIGALVLAPIVSVLGARRPGELAWNFIVLSLLIVFTLPILEQLLLGKTIESGRVALDGPRSAIFGIVVGVGVVNYLATIFWPAALWFGAAAAFEIASLGPWTTAPADAVWRHAVAGMCFAGSAWSAWWIRRRVRQIAGVEAEWARFRNGWGLIWSARVRERWNDMARQQEWPWRLGFGGLESIANAPPADPERRRAAEEHLRFLLRRFL